MWVAEFGQSPASFWLADVSEFQAIYTAWTERYKRDFFFSGSLIAALYNVNSKRGSKTLQAKDIFPFLEDKEKPKEAKSTSVLAAKLRGIAAAREESS